MHGDSSHIRKGTLSPTHSHPTRPYRPSRPHAARWVRWTHTAAMAPALRSCARRKNSCTKRRPHRLPRRVHARRRYPRRRRRARTVEATGEARMTSRQCALRGACVAATTRLRTGRRTGRASIWTRTMRTTMAPGICAWPAHLRIRGSTRSAIFTFCGIFSSIDHNPRPNPPAPPQQTNSLIFHDHASHATDLSSTHTFLLLCSFRRALEPVSPCPLLFFLYFFDALHRTRACCKPYSILSIFRYYSRGTHSALYIYTIQLNLSLVRPSVCVCGEFSIIFVASNPNCPPSLRTRAVFILACHDLLPFPHSTPIVRSTQGKVGLSRFLIIMSTPRDRPRICFDFIYEKKHPILERCAAALQFQGGRPLSQRAFFAVRG
jgi:hypothetical protein